MTTRTLRRTAAVSRSTSEVQTARGDYATLGARLDGIDQLPGAARLAAAVSSGTTFTTRTAISPTYKGLAVLSAFTSAAEAVLITAISGAAVTVSASIANSHSADAVIVLAPGGVLDAGWYGVYGGTTDDMTTLLQNACNDAITHKAVLQLPPGKIYTDGLDLDGVAVFSNSNPCGIYIRGAAQGTILYHTDNTQPCIDLDAGAGNDVVFHLENLRLICSFGSPGSSTHGIIIGENRATCTLKNVQIYGFKDGIRFAGNVDGPLVLDNVQIRSCRGNGLEVDSGVSYITHLMLLGGLIENCGADSNTDAAQYYAVRLVNTRNAEFFGTVIQGNYAGALYCSGSSRLIQFHGGRIEEAYASGSDATYFASMSYAIRLDSSSGNLVAFFKGTHLVFDVGGHTTAPDWELALVQDDTVVFENCYITNAGSTATANVIDAATSGSVALINCHLNNCVATNRRLGMETIGKNLGIFGGADGGSYGGGAGVVYIGNRVAAPSADPTAGGILYVEAGALKYRGSSGTTTTIANA